MHVINLMAILEEDKVVVYCGLSGTDCKDESIVNYVKGLNFKESTKKPGLFYKILHRSQLDSLKDKITVYYYEDDKRYQIYCKDFSTRLERKAVRNDFQRACQERNDFCGYTQQITF